MVFDEATSALDNKSEKEVQKALDNISNKSVTTLIIAHRLSTIRNADLICAIKDGKILAVGSKEEMKTYIGNNTKVDGFSSSYLFPGLVDDCDSKVFNPIFDFC